MSAAHSLTVPELLSRLRELDVRLTVQFDRLNCSAPKGALTGELKAELVRRKLELIELLRASGEGAGLELPVARVVRTGELPLSHAQKRLWFLSLYEPESPAYAISSMVRISGTLDQIALERTLFEIIRRHEVLRTGYMSEGGSPRAVISEAVQWRLEHVDITGILPADRVLEAVRSGRQRVREPFDLAAPPLLRATLFQLSEVDHILLVSVHHIAADGWSLGVMAAELGALYSAFSQGLEAPIEELPFQFVDYVAWNQASRDARVIDQQVAWWLERLRGPLPVLELPADYPRSPVMTYRGACHRAIVDDVALLTQFANASGVTLFMVLLAAFEIVLYRFTGLTDLIVGTAVAGRNRPDVEKLMGLFINTLSLRTSLDGNPTVTEILHRVRETALGAFAHADVPFDQLVAELRPDRDRSHSPVIQVMFTLQNYPFRGVQLPGATLTRLPFDAGIARYELAVDVFECDGALELTFEYNADLFHAATIERIQRSFVRVLEAMTASPATCISAIPLLSAAERAEILTAAAPAATAFPADRCVHELIREQSLRTPARLALACGSSELTYAELERLSDHLAARLESSGVRPGVVAAVCLERSVRLPITLLAILKAGGAYLPLDLKSPPERLKMMLGDSDAKVLVTESSLLDRMPTSDIPIVLADDRLEPGVPTNRPAPADLAYILYTSGSTGKPKGVEITHRSLVNFLFSMRREPGINQNDCLLHITAPGFDIAGLELYLPLLVGARVEVAPRTVVDPLELARLIETRGVTVMQATPALWRMLFDSGWSGRADLKVLCGGDTLSRELAERLLDSCGEVWNLYGPTETTIWSTAAKLKRGMDLVPLGSPIANTSLYILDANHEPVPRGVAGELYIGGAGLARGYRNQPELTLDRFIPSPFTAGERLYRTGDLVRRRSDEGVEFLGRADFQVKIRGYRIEPEEIEKVIEREQGVRQAIVVSQRDGADVQLVGYVVARGEARSNLKDLKAALGEVLPDYMIPAYFMFLDALPLSPNGKVDRAALPRADLRARTSARFEPPRNSAELELTNIWKDLLKIDQVGIHDNFFDLGGHSLLMVRLQSCLRKSFGRELTLLELFQKPTVASIAGSFADEVTRGPRG